MLTKEMLAMVTDENHVDRLIHGVNTVIKYLRRMPGISSSDGSSFTAEAGPQMPRSMQRNLAAIICGEELSVGDCVRIRNERANFWESAGVTPEDIGVITHLRWPNSENCGRLVVQITMMMGGNYHLDATEVVRA